MLNWEAAHMVRTVILQESLMDKSLHGSRTCRKPFARCSTFRSGRRATVKVLALNVVITGSSKGDYLQTKSIDLSCMVSMKPYIRASSKEMLPIELHDQIFELAEHDLHIYTNICIGVTLFRIHSYVTKVHGMTPYNRQHSVFLLSDIDTMITLFLVLEGGYYSTICRPLVGIEMWRKSKAGGQKHINVKTSWASRVGKWSMVDVCKETGFDCEQVLELLLQKNL